MRKIKIQLSPMIGLSFLLFSCQNLEISALVSQKATASQTGKIMPAKPSPSPVNSPIPSPSPVLSPTPKPVPSVLINPVLEVETPAVNFGETAVIQGSGFTPNGMTTVYLFFPPEGPFSGGFSIYPLKADAKGLVGIKYSEKDYTNSPDPSNPNYQPIVPFRLGTHKIYVEDVKSQKKSNEINFEIKKPVISEVKPQLQFETEPTDEAGSIWMKVLGSGFSALAEVSLTHSSPQGVSLETTKTTNPYGKFINAFIIRTDLAHGEYCFEAKDLTTGKVALPVCKTL